MSSFEEALMLTLESDSVANQTAQAAALVATAVSVSVTAAAVISVTASVTATVASSVAGSVGAAAAGGAAGGVAGGAAGGGSAGSSAGGAVPLIFGVQRFSMSTGLATGNQSAMQGAVAGSMGWAKGRLPIFGSALSNASSRRRLQEAAGSDDANATGVKKSAGAWPPELYGLLDALTFTVILLSLVCLLQYAFILWWRHRANRAWYAAKPVRTSMPPAVAAPPLVIRPPLVIKVAMDDMASTADALVIEDAEPKHRTQSLAERQLAQALRIQQSVPTPQEDASDSYSHARTRTRRRRRVHHHLPHGHLLSVHEVGSVIVLTPSEKLELGRRNIGAENRHKGVSHLHLSIRAQGEGSPHPWGYELLCHSQHGTYINSERLPIETPTRLNDGDRIALGRPDRDVGFIFRRGDAAEDLSVFTPPPIVAERSHHRRSHQLPEEHSTPSRADDVHHERSNGGRPHRLPGEHSKADDVYDDFSYTPSEISLTSATRTVRVAKRWHASAGTPPDVSISRRAAAAAEAAAWESAVSTKPSPGLLSPPSSLLSPSSSLLSPPPSPPDDPLTQRRASAAPRRRTITGQEAIFRPLPNVLVFPNLLTLVVNMVITGLAEAAVQLLAVTPACGLGCTWPAVVILILIGAYVVGMLLLVLRFYFGGRKTLWVRATPQTTEDVEDPILRNVFFGCGLCASCLRRIMRVVSRMRGSFELPDKETSEPKRTERLLARPFALVRETPSDSYVQPVATLLHALPPAHRHPTACPTAGPSPPYCMPRRPIASTLHTNPQFDLRLTTISRTPLCPAAPLAQVLGALSDGARALLRLGAPGRDL